MASIWEKAISILAGNLNSGRSYLITAVTIVNFAGKQRADGNVNYIQLLFKNSRKNFDHNFESYWSLNPNLSLFLKFL